MGKKKIVIITRSPSIKYSLVESLLGFWEKAGYQISVQTGIDSTPEADCVLLHYDATEVPSSYINFISRFPSSINGQSNTIEKNLFSDHEIKKTSDYQGSVIIKTKENYGGFPELHSKKYSKYRRRIYTKISQLLSTQKIKNRAINSVLWRYTRVIDPSTYPVFESISEVPNGAWGNQRLLIEKFMPERAENNKYRLRHWYFFGDLEFTRTLESADPIVKWVCMTEDEKKLSSSGWETITVTKDSDTPMLVREVRERLKLDFGRIDWGMHNGQAVIYDVNKTPSLSYEAGETAKGRVLKEFAKGIEQFC